jgi:hypothetical protein
MNRLTVILVLITLGLIPLNYSCGNNGNPVTATAAQSVLSDTPTVTATVSISTTATTTSTQTFTVTPKNSPTSTLTPTPTNSLTFTPTLTPTSTSTSTATLTPTATFTNTATSTPTPTNSPTFTPTNSPTLTPTSTSTSTATLTPTATSTNTATSTPTTTPTACLATTAAGNGTGVSNFNAYAGYVEVVPVTISGSGTIQIKDVSFKINGGTFSPPVYTYVGLYTDNGGSPQSLVSSTEISYGLGWNYAPLHDPNNSGAPLYLHAGNHYWIALSPYQIAANPSCNTSGSILYYQGSSAGLPTVLGSAPATLFTSITSTMLAQIEYCQ